MENSRLKLRNSKYLRKISVIRSFFVEFCDNSNIHGLRYLSERQLHWSERLLWLIAIGASISLCGILTGNIWTKWSENPMTINIIEKEVNISSYPFPTITLCPSIKTFKRTFDVAAVLKRPHNLSGIETKRLNALAHICPRLHNFNEFHEDFADESIYETLRNLVVQFKGTINNCQFKRMALDCDSIIFPVFTSEGLCYTFNALNSHDTYTDQMASGMMIIKGNPNVTEFNLDADLVRTFDEKSYPYQTGYIGVYGGFETFPNFGDRIIKGSNCGWRDGLNLMMTMPGETLATMRNVHRIPFQEYDLISLKAKLSTTSEALRRYDPQQRQCFFDSERQLRFFRIYTQFNCEEECQANFTAIKCGCVPFYMPRDKNTAICGASRIECYNSAARTFQYESRTKSISDRCNCLPACNFIEYIVNIERIEIETESVLEFRTKSVFFMMKLRLFFGSFQAEVVERLSLYSYSDFFADCGSFLGLFMGISALSLVELIYFFTLRLFLTVRPIRISIGETMFASIKRRFTDSRLCQWNSKWLANVFEDYSKNSNIHGILYFTRPGLHWIERFWWIIAFGLSIWLYSALTGNVWVQWQENPVKMSYSKVPISSIPFPTVTICPDIKSSTRKFDSSVMIMNNKLGNTILHSFSMFAFVFHHKFDSIQSVQNSSELIYKTIQDIALQLDDVVKECRWQGQLVNCSKYLMPILTDDGLCFAFNALNSFEIYTKQMASWMKIVNSNPNVTHWNIENGFENQNGGQKYPFPLTDSLEMSLIRYERDNSMLYKASRLGGFSTGFKVAFTMPGETWRLSRSYLQVQASQIAQITLNPKLSTTSDGLRKFTPNQRRCFFQSERKLRFFRFYTKSNCETECLANLTRVKCGCVEFSMPRDEETKTCGLAEYDCYHSLELRQSWSKIAFETGELDECNCLPACTAIEYNPDVDRVRLRTIPAKALRSINVTNDDAKHTKLSIFFENQQIEVINRVEMYTIADFLAICGGLLGLCMGASALSLIELIYFFTLRVFWSMRRERSDNRVMPLNL